MQHRTKEIRFSWRSMWILVPGLLWILAFQGSATAGYADSAHGNGSIGVNRSDSGYNTGDCAQCHDTFDPAICEGNSLMLFTGDTDQDLCFKCHDGTSTVQNPAFNNYNYSITFGGGSAGFTNVKAAFNADAGGGSSHNLATLLNWAVSNHPEWGFTSSSNPCALCHNTHLDKRNWASPQDPTYTAIRRPSEYSSSPSNQWGDGTGERMNANWSTYQAPYYLGGNYEPGGTTSTDGSKHPDYAMLCLDCHAEIAVGGRSGIDWRNEARPSGAWGPIHGEFSYNFGPSLGYLGPQWTASDYVLSCLDCHEPHGSSNKYMLRTTVNAVSGLTYNQLDNNSVRAWCEACHTLTPETEEGCDAGGLCHTGTPSPVHFNIAPYCINCHNHAPEITCSIMHGQCP